MLDFLLQVQNWFVPYCLVKLFGEKEGEREKGKQNNSKQMFSGVPTKFQGIYGQMSVFSHAIPMSLLPEGLVLRKVPTVTCISVNSIVLPMKTVAAQVLGHPSPKPSPAVPRALPAFCCPTFHPTPHPQDTSGELRQPCCVGHIFQGPRLFLSAV